MPRRLKQLALSTDLLASWLRDGTPGFLPVRNHLPEDVRIVEARMHEQREIVLILESDEFPLLADGEPVPSCSPVWIKPAHLFDCPLSLN